MNLPFKRYFLFSLKALGIIIKLVIIDQLTKWWFINYLKALPLQIVKVNKFLNFVYVWNYGISFGMFSEYHQYSNYFFIFLNILIVIYLGFFLLRTITLKAFLGYCFVIGGACGNLYDRIIRGAVFDFIDIHYYKNHFAIFNLADAFITIGAALLILDYYLSNRLKQSIADELLIDPEDMIEIEADKIRRLAADERKNKIR